MLFLMILVLVVGLVCSVFAGAAFAEKRWGVVVGSLFFGLVCLASGVASSVVRFGKGNPDIQVRMDAGAIYQLVWQGQVDGKPYAVLVEMEDIQELTSADRNVRFYRLDAPLPARATYYRFVKKYVDGIEKGLLEPFSLPPPVPATP